MNIQKYVLDQIFIYHNKKEENLHKVKENHDTFKK